MNSRQNIGVIINQLSIIGIPKGIIDDVMFSGYDELYRSNKPFAKYKWTEKGTPVFKFDTSFSLYNSFNDLIQPRYVVLMGLEGNGDYQEAGVYEDVNSLLFKETMSKYSKIYLADFDCKPLREQILNPTTMEAKINRLKAKLSR
jgi:hypothetical protein